MINCIYVKLSWVVFCPFDFSLVIRVICEICLIRTKYIYYCSYWKYIFVYKLGINLYFVELFLGPVMEIFKLYYIGRSRELAGLDCKLNFKY